MIIDSIETARFNLRCLAPNENLERYLSWMQNVESFPYIESARHDYSQQKLAAYIESVNASRDSVQLSIFERESKIHIGNIKFHDMNFQSSSSYVGFLIGDLSWQNRGVSLEVFESTSYQIFKLFNITLYKLMVNSSHVQAIRAYSKIGFVQSVPYTKNHMNSNSILMTKSITSMNF